MEFKPITKKSVSLERQDSSQGLLIVQSANECIQKAKNQPIPLKLCGNFWFEGEVGILFADTNVGKSIFAVQVADNISRGNNEGVFQTETQPQKGL